jgi:PPOX class probable F420-dependent enzyme
MTMGQEEIQQVLGKSNNAIIGVNREGEKAPQLTVVWYAWDGTSFFVSITKDRAKYPNIKRNPSISLIVDDPESFQYIAAYGKAEIIEDNFEAQTRLILQKYVPADQLEQRVKAIVDDPKRVIIALRPEKLLTH